MQNSQEVARLIKSYAKSKNIQAGTLLSDCGLSKNTLSSMQSGGYYPRIEAICKIADYLDCSVDYLLGRTSDPYSHKSNIASQTFAARLREAMRIRSAQLIQINPKKDYGAVYWAEKSNGKFDAYQIAVLLDAGTSDRGIMVSIAALFNVSVDQLTGEEEITEKNIRSYMLKPLGTVDGGMRFSYSAANSDDGTYDENTDIEDDTFIAMANEPRGEDVT